ncbi:MAG: 50S ribosomal protein L30 [Egibacteraceae bacterium]
MGQLAITQVRSLIGVKADQRRTIQALGLRRIRHTVVKPDRPEFRGMIAKVSHLVEVSELPQATQAPAGSSGNADSSADR